MRALVAICALAACESAPDAPTYIRDVKPILDANCVRCHGLITRGGAPERFRLDLFSDSLTDDGRPQIGAGLVSGFIAARTHAETMPPVTPLSDVQIDTLQNWQVVGEEEAEEGEIDPTDLLPEIQRLAVETDAEGVLSLEYRISDPDFDVVTGRLFATPLAGGDTIVVTRELYSGIRTARWDTGVVAAGNYLLRAEIDDGQRGLELELGEISVVHPNGNQAPTAEVCNLSRSQIISELPFDLEIAAADDGLSVSIEVFAERGDESIPLGSAADVAPSDCGGLPAVISVPDLSALTPGVDYRLRVAVDDGERSRDVVTLPFIAGAGDPAGAPSFSAEISPIFAARCSGCHKRDPLSPIGADFTNVVGAQAFDSVVYRRVIQERSMPPGSAELLVPGFSPMTQAERDLVAAWLLAGAPDN